jgi:Glycosyl hydrolase family 9
MTTNRLAYRIDATNPGSDLAAETAAAMASASVVFLQSNPAYSNELLEHAKQVIVINLVIYFEPICTFFICQKFKKMHCLIVSALTKKY